MLMWIEWWDLYTAMWCENAWLSRIAKGRKQKLELCRISCQRLGRVWINVGRRIPICFCGEADCVFVDSFVSEHLSSLNSEELI